MMTKAFVTGWPVSHSKSPLLHGYWIKEHEIDGSYEPVAVEPESFKTFINELQNSKFVGGNVTMPHKEAAFEYTEKTGSAANKLGAVNTLWFENGKLNGDNTDAYGFSANLDDYHSEWRDMKQALVLGAGGASRAVIYSLIEAGFDQVHIVNRTVERAQSLVERFGDKTSAHSFNDAKFLMTQTNLLVNTTSIGMDGSQSSALPNLEGLPDHALVTDIVYTPLQTPLLEAAAHRGLRTIDGLGMLLHQAVPGFEKWFGVRPKVTGALRNYILEQS
ncbi:MAG: shikimate dehydrogenase [Pseudomonadota bacterium]